MTGKYITKTLLGIFILGMLTGCGDPIKKVVEQNIKGLKKQNIQMVMETIDPDSPVYEETERQVKQLLESYNLKFKIESIDILEKPLEKKKEEKKPEKEAASEDDIFNEDFDFVTEEDKEKAEEKKKNEEENKKNKPLVARVKVVQVTSQKQGANPFHNNRVVVVHTLHKYPNRDEKPTWKIYKSEINDVEFLVDKGKKKGKS